MLAGHPTHQALEARLEHRLELVHGRDRLTAELHRLAVDVVGRAEHDEIGPEDKARLHRAMALAVARTEREVADRLVHELADALAEAPDDLFLRLASAEVRRDLGLD